METLRIISFFYVVGLMGVSFCASLFNDNHPFGTTLVHWVLLAPIAYLLVP